MNTTLDIDDIRAAAVRLQGQVIDTPCLPSRTLSAIAGCEVFLKFENHQFTASFKERGALNKMAQLTDARTRAGRARGVGRQPCTGRGPTTRNAWALRPRS